MSYVRCLRGISSGAEYPADRVMNLCPEDGRPVEMIYALDRLQVDHPDRSWYHPERNDLWRFGALLPLDIDDPADRSHIVSLGEGYTPVLDYADHPLAQKVGFRLEVKDEGRPRQGFGHNPTQSFKDRGMAVVASMASRLGLQRLALPTQGNAGDSLVTYAVEAGLEAAVAMPAETPMPILGKVAAYGKLYAGIHLEAIHGTFAEAGTLIDERYTSDGFFNVATFREPGWRIEGKKTMGLELAEPRSPDAPWQLPDVVVYPTGGGTGILGMWKAFDELEVLGLIGPHRPRMVCVQTEATPSIAEAFAAGATDTVVRDPGETVACGLNVPHGVGHFRVLEILDESNGHALAVSDEAILSTLHEVSHTKRWWICPEGAATLAALDALVDEGVIRSGDHVVVFNTASLEKYLPDVRHVLDG